MKNIKIIIEIFLILFFIAAAIFVIFEDSPNVKDELINELVNYTGTVDEQIEALTSDERYKSLEHSDKEHLVRSLLIHLNINNSIGPYRYDFENRTMLFEYIDGRQGTIKIE